MAVDILAGVPMAADGRVWAVVAGYVLASGLGGAIVTPLVSAVLAWELRRRTRGAQPPGDRWVTLDVVLLGIVERVLYTSAVWLGQFAFIGIWVALKAAAQWRRWTEERVLYNLFLVGTAVSLAFGVLGGIIVRELWPDG